MGTKGRSIIGMDVDRLVALLNSAFADEWLAYYQYWIGAQVVQGPMKDAAITELNEHAADELRHALMVSSRIIQMGGTPLTNPKLWMEQTNCGYEDPTNPYIKPILEQNIKGEQCAIETYHKLLGITEGKDPVTFNMVVQILQDEIEHEQDLQDLLEDYEDIVKRGPR